MDLSFIDCVLFFSVFLILGMFLHQQVHLLQWNSHVHGFLCTPAKQLGYLCSERSNPRRQCSEKCSEKTQWSFTDWVSQYYTSACFMICLQSLLLMWTPVGERCRAQVLSCQLVIQTSRTVNSAGTSVQNQSSFECNRSGINVKTHERTCCNAYNIFKSRSSIFKTLFV